MKTIIGAMALAAKAAAAVVVAFPAIALFAWIDAMFDSNIPADEDYEGDPGEYFVSDLR